MRFDCAATTLDGNGLRQIIKNMGTKIGNSAKIYMDVEGTGNMSST